MDRLRERSAVGTAVRSFVEPRFGIDSRALAVFRISLGLLLLADLVFYRIPGARAFYTDSGVFPRSMLAEVYPTFASVSIHALSGSIRWQYTLFGLAMAFAILLTVGYRTRSATFVSVLLLASMQARNPYVLNGGDTILLSFLLLGLFLPLERRWSLDALRLSSDDRTGRTLTDDRADRTLPDDRVLSLASATILLHIVLIYVTNALLKYRSEPWMNGTAVRRAFQSDQFLATLGPYLAEFSLLLTATNWLWTVVLSLSVFLLVFTGHARTLLVLAVVGSHLGMAATMRLGIFPFVLITGLLLFVPSGIWNWLESTSPVSIPALASIAVSDWIPSGLGTAIPRSRSVRRSARVTATVIVACLLVLLVVFHAAQVGLADPASPELEEEIGDAGWAFFAPNPPDTTIDYVLEGHLEDGESIDLIRGGDLELDRPPDPGTTFATTLWQRYGLEIRYADESQYEPLVSYVCERSAYDIEGVTIYYLEQPVGPDGPIDDTVASERISKAC